MRQCPNCGQAIAEGTAGELCPNCGAALPPLPEVGKEEKSSVRLMTGNAWVDGILGFLTFVATMMLYASGLILGPLLYFLLRKRYPAYATGLRIGLLLLFVPLLGALAVCGVMFAVNGVFQ
jgi:hypothetical protein